ncbi:hypothetical protein [Nocardioides nanhaiensis]|uniref:Uncharacterized protein n=1 Tax=Nocardioides nanhaiensis TaxID=1476871 RepID=A0ABP8W1N8_9ACTN
MEVLLWLAPAAVVTAVAMAWAGWAGRQKRDVVDRDEAVRRLGAALERGRGTPGYAVPQERARTTERSTGVAVRRGTPTPPRPEPAPTPVTPVEPVEPVEPAAQTPTPAERDDRPHRRAS